MGNRFFEKPILNSPYEYPGRYWELDKEGQPTQRIIEKRRRAEFITPIPKPRKRKGSAQQQQLIFDEGKGLSTQEQQYDPTSIINELRSAVDQWRSLPNPNDWKVTPETARVWISGLEAPYRYGSEMRKYIPDFIVLVDDGHGNEDLLHLIVEIKGYRREDAKEKKSTMETYWAPGVNHAAQYGRWAFAEFAEIYQIEADFKARVESEFDRMIEKIVEGAT
jgi:hypothetical protein